MTNALEVRGLRKSYGEKAVLKGIDLSVGRGDIFAARGRRRPLHVSRV